MSFAIKTIAASDFFAMGLLTSYLHLSTAVIASTKLILGLLYPLFQDFQLKFPCCIYKRVNEFKYLHFFNIKMHVFIAIEYVWSLIQKVI
jgi:heme exporter protein D